MPGSNQLDVRDRAAVAARIKGSVCSKMYGFEDLLSPLIAQVRRALSHARAQAPQVHASQFRIRLAGLVTRFPVDLGSCCITTRG